MSATRIFLIIFFLALLNGCSTTAEKTSNPAINSTTGSPMVSVAAAASPEVEPAVVLSSVKGKANYAVVRTFFATDRKPTRNKQPSKMFGATPSSNISYGVCEVSIPRDHRMGKLESPSIRRFEFRENLAKHVVLLNILVADKGQFFKDMATRIGSSKGENAFLFVHGFNVTFADAARRTAQISYDLAFQGAPVFYSWPSEGSIPSYMTDERNIKWAKPNLEGFLEDFFKKSKAKNIYLIAHSMGSRALTRALTSLLNKNPGFKAKLREVILAAPDIDSEIFKRDIAPKLAQASGHTTLYASSEDVALTLSKKGHKYPRAGDSGQGLVIVAGIETIDATGMDTGFLKHSYFAGVRSVLSDMYYLITNGKRADQRFGLLREDTEAGPYWKFKP